MEIFYSIIDFPGVAIFQKALGEFWVIVIIVVVVFEWVKFFLIPASFACVFLSSIRAL